MIIIIIIASIDNLAGCKLLNLTIKNLTIKKGRSFIAFKNIFEDIYFNYQANRVLLYGDLAYKRDEIYEISDTIVDVESWYKE